jgi:lactate dehydrogenase-like 2-hydroxyacid dehydrogenase
MQRLKKVILTHPLPDDWIISIRDRCEIIVGPDNSMGVDPLLESDLRDAEGLIALLSDKIDERIISLAPNLKVVCNMAAGTDNIDLITCSARKIPVGFTPGVLTNATADLAIGLMLAVNRELMISATAAKNGDWKMWHPDKWLGMELEGTTLGIIGMGKIGSAVAKRASSFGMSIIYVSRSQKPVIEKAFSARKVELNKLFEQSDIISLHAPLNPETYHMVNQDAFRRMKSSAMLINTARGGEVDTGALYQALSTGQIKAAGLDVTDPEPLPPDHPLYSLPNCVILPHIGSATERTRKRMAEMTCENLIAGLYGEKLPYCVNPEIYR